MTPERLEQIAQHVKFNCLDLTEGRSLCESCNGIATELREFAKALREQSALAACAHQSMKVISSSAVLECRTCGYREIQERRY